ncbi:dynein regulatory complex protein 1 isoform X1 [Amphiprion ocellaris]|uniref:Dynein regulatory complex protein 1/2 N-terminal domain-containing protein n=1 Tax=Amphiprion ocellaris TaxID=80972 RepID=A0AAQ5ZRJ5_AMPOC|nr:dynein regulatory complex protein 1 isoform X1 [Amphiprion ocellaris]
MNMENVDKDPEEAPGRSVFPQKQETKTGLSTQKVEENPNKEVTEQPKREEEQEHTKRMINLQREPATFVTNIQPAGDAKSLERRAELEEARRIRRERQENDVKASQEKFDEIKRSWLTLNEKMMPQELHEALNCHQLLCDTIIAEKKKLINDLQQELKKRDDHYVKTLRKNEEDIDLLIERMEEQIGTLTKAYREELGQTEGFLMERKLLKLLAPLEKEEQTFVKLTALFHSLGIEGEDVPELVDFLLKYKQEQGVQTEDVCAESSDVTKAAETSSSTNKSSELIHYSNVLPALRSFLKQRVESRESTAHQRSSVGHAEAPDASDYKAYWDSMANITHTNTTTK